MSETSVAPVRARRVRAEAPPVAPPVASPPPPAHQAEAPPRQDVNGEALGPVPMQRARKPLGRQYQKLDNSERPGFHRHWFNDDDKGRVKDALEAGYTHVLDNEGKPMSRVVSRREGGGGLLAYRMEIPIDWYRQDQDEKVAARRQRQQDMQRGVTGTGAPGEDGRYVPLGPDGRPLTQVTSSASRKP